MKIRKESKKDYFEVENVTREAFWNVYRPGCFEHFVIHKLRADEDFVKELDYIIEEDGKIISNIVYALGRIKKDNGKVEKVLIFGPVSVLPDYQKKGYGKAIINYTLKRAEKLGYAGVFIVGNPDYYKKYGFVPASKYGIFYEGMDKNEEAPFFMVKVFDESKIKKLKGVYSDPVCYKVDQKEVDDFDKNFCKKRKLKRPGQLG